MSNERQQLRVRYYVGLMNYFYGWIFCATRPSFVMAQFMYVCVCVCVVIPFVLNVRFVDVPAGVTHEDGHTGFVHLPSAVFASIFIARRIQPFLSLVDREVELCVLTIQSFSTC